MSGGTDEKAHVSSRGDGCNPGARILGTRARRSAEQDRDRIGEADADQRESDYRRPWITNEQCRQKAAQRDHGRDPHQRHRAEPMRDRIAGESGMPPS
jgi:hypothetical protein